MIAFTTDFPRKSSRTSTQAVIVPRTALKRDTASEATSVSFSAATASGLETASQNACVPSLVASHMSAAIGRPTMTIRNVVTMPRDRAVAALSLDARARRGPATAISASTAADLPLDPGHDARLRVEEALLHLLPAAEPSSSIVKRPGRTGNFLRFAFSTLFTTGR